MQFAVCILFELRSLSRSCDACRCQRTLWCSTLQCKPLLVQSSLCSNSEMLADWAWRSAGTVAHVAKSWHPDWSFPLPSEDWDGATPHPALLPLLLLLLLVILNDTAATDSQRSHNVRMRYIFIFFHPKQKKMWEHKELFSFPTHTRRCLWLITPHHTHPLVLIDPFEGVLRQRLVHVAQLGHHGGEQLGTEKGQFTCT